MVNYFEMNFSLTSTNSRNQNQPLRAAAAAASIVNATNSNSDSRNFCTRTLSISVWFENMCVKNWTFYFSIKQILIKEFL